MRELYPNLPGYQTILTDGVMVVTDTVASTQSVLLMGTAVDGPLNQPVRVTSLQDAEAVFGSVVDKTTGKYNKATLILAFQEAAEAGCNDIRLMRVTGTKAKKVLSATAEGTVPLFSIEAKYPGVIYDDFTVTHNTTTNKFTIASTNKAVSLDYTATKSVTLVSDLVDEINSDINNTYFVAVDLATEGTKLPATALLEVTTSKVAGTDGTSETAANMYTALETSFDAIKDYIVDIVVPLGVYQDNGSDNETEFAQLLANYCATMSAKDNVTIGVIATSPLADPSLTSISTMITKLKGATYENKYEFQDADGVTVNDAEGNPIDAGKFISVIVGEAVFKNSKLGGEYVNTLAAAYAGMISALGAASSPTNKSIPNIKRMTYRLSLSQLDELTAAKYVTIRQRDAVAVITSGITCAFTNSYYSRLSTVRIVGTVIDTVVKAAEPFIGEPNTVIQRNTLHTAIKSSLDALMAVSIINNYKFQLFSSAQDMVNGLINVDIEIVPAFELRKIKTTITLKTNI